jgi:hypothetical protein
VADDVSEGVAALAAVELGQDPPPERLVIAVVQQVDRLRGPPDVLQHAGERGEVAGVAAQRPNDCTFEVSLMTGCQGRPNTRRIPPQGRQFASLTTGGRDCFIHDGPGPRDYILHEGVQLRPVGQSRGYARPTFRRRAGTGPIEATSGTH